MDGAKASGLYPTVDAVATLCYAGSTSRGVAAVRVEGFGREPAWSRRRVQILVVVANIQTRTLKTEVEKGSM